MGFAVESLRISAGILVWAVHFAAVYGIAALGCARGWAHAVPASIGAVTLVAAVAAAALVVAGWRRRARFEHWLSASIAAFALLAIVLEAIPAWLVPTCA